MISGPVLTTDDIMTVSYATRAKHGNVAYEWQVGRAYWSALYNLKTADGTYLWKPGIGSASPLYLMGWPIRLVDEDSIQLVPIAATGDTQRLDNRQCRECGDELPDGAQYCITCGAPTA